MLFHFQVFIIDDLNFRHETRLVTYKISATEQSRLILRLTNKLYITNEIYIYIASIICGDHWGIGEVSGLNKAN